MQPVHDNASLASRTGHNTLNHRRAMHSTSDMPEARGQVLQADMAQGFPLRPSSIDGAISISAVQWLCHMPNPEAALQRMFSSLYKCLKPRCRAVLQVYLTGTVVPPTLCCDLQFGTKLSFKASPRAFGAIHRAMCLRTFDSDLTQNAIAEAAHGTFILLTMQQKCTCHAASSKESKQQTTGFVKVFSAYVWACLHAQAAVPVLSRFMQCIARLATFACAFEPESLMRHTWFLPVNSVDCLMGQLSDWMLRFWVDMIG